jgi:hypothetical protein
VGLARVVGLGVGVQVFQTWSLWPRVAEAKSYWYLAQPWNRVSLIIIFIFKILFVCFHFRVFNTLVYKQRALLSRRLSCSSLTFASEWLEPTITMGHLNMLHPKELSVLRHALLASIRLQLRTQELSPSLTFVGKAIAVSTLGWNTLIMASYRLLANKKAAALVSVANNYSCHLTKRK